MLLQLPWGKIFNIDNKPRKLSIWSSKLPCKMGLGGINFLYGCWQKKTTRIQKKLHLTHLAFVAFKLPPQVIPCDHLDLWHGHTTCILLLKRRRPEVEMKTMFPDGIYYIFFTYLQTRVFFSQFCEVGSFTIIYKKTG